MTHAFSLPASATSASSAFKGHYEKFLKAYELKCVLLLHSPRGRGPAAHRLHFVFPRAASPRDSERLQLRLCAARPLGVSASYFLLDKAAANAWDKERAEKEVAAAAGREARALKRQKGCAFRDLKSVRGDCAAVP